MVDLISPRAWRWLQAARPARVLHVFGDVCNLVNDRGDVLSLVTPRIGPGPLAIVLSGFSTAGLDDTSPARVAGERLTIGPRVIDWRRATTWTPRPDWSRLRVRPTDWPPPEPLPPDLDAPLGSLLEGLVAGDWAACLAGARRLAGRGAGLTPAGDDVLLGVFYALWVWQTHFDWVARLVAELAPLTTTLSANLLRAAAEGEAGWQWHDVVNDRPGAVAALLAVGHTSGADAWAGFVAAYSRYKALQKVPCT